MSKKIKIVETGMFCRVLNSSYAQYGVKKEDVVYLAGEGMVAVTEDDPYAFRKIFIAARMVGDVVDVEGGGFTIDGKSLKPCTKIKQERLTAIHEAAFKEPEADEVPH